MVQLTDTVLRDAHQSLLATRMSTADMLPVAEKLDRVGYFSLEAWGGATFDSCLRFLKEDPWERVVQLHELMPRTPLQMLLRGQNIVGYRHYADDVVQRFVEQAFKLGIGVFRIFDALNDLRNLETAIKAGRATGAHTQGTISYTVSPVHTLELYRRIGAELAALEVDSICIKDMAGILTPATGFELISRLKEDHELPIHLHCHYTSGMASATYQKAVEAGADILDTALSPLALGTSQPPTESIIALLKDTPYDTGLDLALVSDIARHFVDVRARLSQFESRFTGVDTSVLLVQVPGGMMSNLANQLREQNALGRMGEVLDEVPRVREELGFPPLVTPTSQIVGVQAVLNVLFGRYQMVSKETRAYVKGLYGHPPGEMDPKIRERILGDETAITGRPADDIEPQFESMAAKLRKQWPEASNEDILSYCLFPQVALDFFSYRAAGGVALDDEQLRLLAAAVAALSPGKRKARVESASFKPGPWAMAVRTTMARGGGYSEI